MSRKVLPQTYATELAPHIESLLVDLFAHPYPTVPSSPDNPRRASVALILRFQPHYSHWPERIPYFDASQCDSTEAKIHSFFQQEWVKYADPEILFIKRAANKNDHWTGHVAFPGGRRDPEDADDCAAAVRETFEEVGLDISESGGYAIQCGNLPQTIITSTWGSKALMTFCPYVFLMTNPAPPMRLQPSEVASAHWVPVRSLLNPKFRTYWIEDISHRSSKQKSYGFKRLFHRFATGRIIFNAIRLHPSESKVASDSREYAPTKATATALDTNVTVPLFMARGRLEAIEDSHSRLLLWGITLGVVSDFLDMLPPYDIIRAFVYPSFTRPDMRFFLWLLTVNYRRKCEVKLRALAAQQADDDAKNASLTDSDARHPGRLRVDARGRRGKLMFDLLPPYFAYFPKATMLALVFRFMALSSLGWLVWKKTKL